MAPQRKRDRASTNESTKSRKQPTKKQKGKEKAEDEDEDDGLKFMFENSEIKSDIWRGMFLVLSI